MATRKTTKPQPEAERDSQEHAREQAEEQARQEHQSARDEDDIEEPMNPVRGRNEYQGGTGNPSPDTGSGRSAALDSGKQNPSR